VVVIAPVAVHLVGSVQDNETLALEITTLLVEVAILPCQKINNWKNYHQQPTVAPHRGRRVRCWLLVALHSMHGRQTLQKKHDRWFSRWCPCGGTGVWSKVASIAPWGGAV
jgi:hypothetical protein